MQFPASEFSSILIAAIFVQNVVFVMLLCSNNFFKTAKSPATGLIYSACITVCVTFASAGAWLVNRYLLVPFGLKFLAPFAFVLVIALLEVVAELLLIRFAPALHRRLGRLLPATAFNCAVLGIVFYNIQTSPRGFFGAVFYGFCAGLGYILAFMITAAAMKKLEYSNPPTAFGGLPIALITAGIMSMAFMGFMNIQILY
ncbi:MAG: Rnf-Nqr domain containing protein [Clostridia bacterium]|nr:Rnf-Nqr domain containing protein [Clostridia bacterium]MDR3644029.1 Rnf-Nqr domain containing protein [Clostridia bacterium]